MKYDVTTLKKNNRNEGTLRPKIYLKRSAAIFSKQTAIGSTSGLSNETLCILLSQGAKKSTRGQFRTLKTC